MTTTITNKGVRCYLWGAELLPSVSACLDILYPNDLCWVEDEHLEMGSRLHVYMAEYARWLYKGGPQPSEQNVDIARLRQLKKWLADSAREVSHIEQTEKSDRGYAGTVDLSLLSWSRNRIVVDYKFAETVGERYYVQLEAYRRMLTRPGMVWQAKILQVKRDGTLKIIRVQLSAARWAAFLSALNVAKWRMKA